MFGGSSLATVNSVIGCDVTQPEMFSETSYCRKQTIHTKKENVVEFVGFLLTLLTVKQSSESDRNINWKFLI